MYEEREIEEFIQHDEEGMPVSVKTIKKDIRCPRCGENKMYEEQAMNALSRRDNDTYICSDCGAAEAMEDHFKQERMPWADEDKYFGKK